MLIAQYNSYWDGYNAIVGGDGGGSRGDPFTIEGKKYPSLQEAIDAYGLTRGSVVYRITRGGWTNEQAILSHRPLVVRLGKA